MKQLREFLGTLLPFLKDKNKTVIILGLMAAMFYVDTATWNKPDSVFHITDGAWKVINCTGLSIVFIGKWLFPTGKMEKFHKWSFYVTNGLLTASAFISIWTPVASPEFIVYTSALINGVMEGYNYFAKIAGVDPVPLPTPTEPGAGYSARGDEA